MSLIKNRFATVLVLLLILAVCHAHPHGADESFDNMEWPDLFSVGEQFADAFAYNEFNGQMTPHSRPSNSRTITSPPHRSRPLVQPQLQPNQIPPADYEQDYFSFTAPGHSAPMEIKAAPSNPQSAPILTFAQEENPNPQNCNGTALAQWVGDQGVMQPQMQQMGQAATGYLISFGGMSAPSNAANMYGYPNAPQMRHQSWPAQPQPPFPGHEHGLHGLDAAHFNTHGSMRVPSANEQLGFPPAQPMDSVPQILPSEVTSNPNYQPGMIPSAPGNMLGWINRAPAIGERTLPSRLDTNHLAPPEANSANRSPTSASTTGSSARAGSRRQKWEMTGDFVCHWCSAGFTTQGDLKHHLRSHQPYLSRQHVCQHCNKRFQYRKDLMRHLPKHDPNRKRYYCIFTGCKYHNRGFGRQDHLDRHIQTQHRIDTPQQSSRPSSTHA